MTTLLFGTLLVAVSASAIVTNKKVEDASTQERIAGSVVQGINVLSYLSNEYFIHHEPQHLARWRSRFALLSSDIASFDVNRPEQQSLVRSIQVNQQRLKDVFEEMVSTIEGLPADGQADFDRELFGVAWSRMAVQSQDLESDASHLVQSLSEQGDQLKRANLWVVYAMIGVFSGYFVINYLIVQSRALGSIAVLQSGTEAVGSGDLNFRLEERRNDEIGDLAVAFNRMTASLKDVTASKADLEMEIAERMEAEQHLRRTKELLERLYQVEQELRRELEAEIARRADFLRVLVHELKTPLTPVLASTELLVEGLEGMQLRLAKNVHLGAAELNRRVDELLDLARGEMGMLTLNRQPMSLLDMLEEVAANMGPVASARNLTLVSRLPPSMPSAMIDGDRIRQVLLNLIGNAVKFTPPGGQITVSARVEVESIVVDVQDTGRGLDEEEQKELFQPYRRLIAGSERLSGLGIGLALSRNIVTLHGGKIGVASRKGTGSTFSFSIPVGEEGAALKTEEGELNR